MIKPCPFCNSNNIEVIHEADRDGESYYVDCHDCGSRGPFKMPNDFCEPADPISFIVDPEILAETVANDFVDNLFFSSGRSGLGKRIKPKTEYEIGKDKAKEAAIEAWNNYVKTT